MARNRLNGRGGASMPQAGMPRSHASVLQDLLWGRTAPATAGAPPSRGYGGKAPMSARYESVSPRSRAFVRPPLWRHAVRPPEALPTHRSGGAKATQALKRLDASELRMHVDRSLCAQRTERKQVLFAKNVAGRSGVGRGKPQRRTWKSNFSCKR